MEINEGRKHFKICNTCLFDEIKGMSSFEEQLWLLKRLEGKLARRKFTKVLKNNGVAGIGFGQCTEAIQSKILGISMVDMCGSSRLNKEINLRDQLTIDGLIAMSMSELLAVRSIIKSSAYGNQSCIIECKRAAEKVVSLFD